MNVINKLAIGIITEDSNINTLDIKEIDRAEDPDIIIVNAD